MNHKAAAKKAGEDKLQSRGWYATIREASENVSTDNYVKGLPAFEVFAFIADKRVTNKVEYRTNVFLSEDSLKKQK